MGFFPHLFDIKPAKLVRNIVLPIIPLNQELVKIVGPTIRETVSGLKSIVSGLKGPAVPAVQTRQSLSPNFIPVQQYSPYGQQSGYAPYGPYYGGTSSWDSSIYSTPSTVAPVSWTSASTPWDSAGTATWEDFLFR